ncbi:MAG: LysR family transcriptional regulator [Microcoleus sp. PH2017_10_PVI_O_A]|nr:LysR family transcriptional regulator [Microcoleus sp. PH2017_10_PVI_O_A]MCC3458555.1 LysR family transcriptional regulator [Microcoleus sp. PH2017_11_PCY_U_A]MCC3476805.1 LysR family transcriptional regulator [Microcoleus sp. PH2017_12_PCY_D_A]MCC3559133.1 LysR family transcriptional regulator [Microcoleus sp. PH2017_27_LUM_O_A]TAE83484.1 MAG: LysR family transcriptional regulator [Oscillatoriales cyanobacterium]
MNFINTRRMKLSQIQALIAVAEYANFSEAALQMELSQSAVSHAIASLEAELGVQLFHRGRHGAQLTPVGERVVLHGRQIVRSLEMMVKEADLDKGLQGGQVRIVSFRSVATHILPGIIAQFRDRFPKIAVSITEVYYTQAVEEALRSGKADIGFVSLPISDEFETREILRDKYVVLLPPTAKLSSAKITWEELANHPLILQPPETACSIPLRKYLATSDFPLNIAYELSEDSTIVSMVMQGLGAAIMPRLAAEPIPAEVKVCSLPADFERVIGVAVLRDALLIPAVFAFLDLVKTATEIDSDGEFPINPS